MEPVACSVDAKFLLARAFRWAREAVNGPAVEFTIVANTVSRAAGTDDADPDADDLTEQTTPGFHSRLSIASGVLDYTVEDEERAGGLPLEATLSGRARQRFSYQRPAINVEDDAPNPPVGPPFVAGAPETAEEMALTITQLVHPGGLDFTVVLESFEGDETEPQEERSFDALQVAAGVLTGMAGEPDATEYVISLRQIAPPLATPAPNGTPVADATATPVNG